MLLRGLPQHSATHQALIRQAPASPRLPARSSNAKPVTAERIRKLGGALIVAGGGDT